MKILNAVSGYRIPASFFTETQNNAHNDLQKIAGLFGAGIVEGLVPTRNPGDGTVSISAGYGWDGDGRMINVETGFPLNFSSLTRPAEGKYKKVAVLASYRQVESETIKDESGNEYWKYRSEGIRIFYVEGAEADSISETEYAAIESNSILLVDVVLDHNSDGCLSIDLSRRPNPANTGLFLSLFFSKMDSVKYSKQLGELFFLDSWKAPSEMINMDPGSYFPGICLDGIDGHLDISEANWPELVTHLRAKKLSYREGRDNEKSTFSVSGWNISSNIATLTFENLTAEKAILAALAEDRFVHGSYENWRSITIPSDIEDIPAGEYAITNVNPESRQIGFDFSASNNSGSGSYSVNFYSNRVPGSISTARIFEASARTLVSANDTDGEAINGLRRRDRAQGHGHYIPSFDSIASPLQGGYLGGYAAAGSGGPSNMGRTYYPREIGYGTPRIGKTTDPRTQVGHLYLWGRSYTA